MKFTVQRHRLIERLRPNDRMLPLPARFTISFLETYLWQLFLSGVSCPSSKKITKHTKRQKYIIWSDRASIRTSLGRHVGIIRWRIKTTITNRLRIPVNKVDSI